ncbi:uncharacterized protein LOC105385401 isoform X1 [Plutella xylostella]|uniref:uncharacterized protein LOC105385401 isoform X1 n=1 Tax=Plutella xylostella TaxID=51655 RepID=UPI0020324023|nr:uncharacterized protein LOC105385401 isoform X1 [Plutella xylostella]
MSNVESQHTKGSETETELKLKRRRSQRRRSRQRYSNDHISKIKFLTISESSGKLYKDSTVQMNSDIIKLARTTDRATCADYECGDCGTITEVKEFMTDNETHVSEDFIEASSRATAMETSPNVCSNATHIDKEFLCDNPISTYLYNKKEIYFSQAPEKSHADTKAEQVSMVISNYVTDSKSCDCSLDYEMPQIFAVATAASQPIPCEPKTDDMDLNVLFSSKGLNKKTNEEIISYSEDQYYMDEKQLDAFTLDISDHLIKKTSSHTSSSLSHNTSTPRNKHCAYESPRVSVDSAKSKLSEKSAIIERSDSGGADIRTCKSSYEIATVDMSASCTSYKTTAMKTFSEKSMVIQERGTSADTMSQETGYECTQPRSSTFLSEVGSLTLDLGDLSDHQDPLPEAKAVIPEDLGHVVPDLSAKHRDKRNIACLEIQLDVPTSTEVVVEVASKKNRPSRIPKLNSKAARTKSLDLRSTSNISSGDTASVKSHIPILTSKPRDDIAVNTATTETDSKINVTL